MSTSPTHTRQTIGFITSGIGNPISTNLWTGAVDAARQQNVNLICFVGESLKSPHGYKSLANIVYDLVSPRTVDGLLFWNSALSNYVKAEEFTRFRSRFSPLPMVDMEEPPDDVTESYSYSGMQLVLKHLIEVHECRRIAFIRGPEGNCEAEYRYQAYCDVLRDAQISFEPKLVTPPGRWGKEWGEHAVQLLLDERKVSFDALAAPSDLLAVSAMKALEARDIHVPKDLAVVGIDDSIEGRYATPSLTTMPYSLYDIGLQGLRRLTAHIAGEKTVEQDGFPARLIIRQSCGCLPPSIADAAVGITPHTESGLTRAIEDQREEILTEMMQAFEAPEFSRPLVKRVLNAFEREFEEPAVEGFLTILDDVLRFRLEEHNQLSHWQGAISALCRRVLPYLSERKQLLRAEDLWQQARVMIGEAEQRAQGSQRLEQDARAQILRKISARLISTFDVEKLMDILAEELPQLGIVSCYVSVYENADRPTDKARLLLAYNENGRIELKPGKQCFPSRQLAPEGLLSPERQYSMVVTPLYFEHHFGFALFEVGPREGNIYGMLSGQISSALQGAFLVQRVKDHMAEITRQQYILDTFMDTVPDRIYFKDCDGRITRANTAHAMRRGLGNPTEEIGKTDFDFFPKEQALICFQQEQGILQSGTSLMNIEEEIVLSDGKKAWALTTKMPLRNEHGEIIGIFGISRDITDLKQAEQELRQYRHHLEELVKERTEEITRINVCLSDEIIERKRVESALRVSEQQYRLLAENVRNGVVIVQNKKIVFANEVFAGMLGYAVDSILQRPSSAFFPESLGPFSFPNGDECDSVDSPRQVELMTDEAVPIWTEIECSSIVWDTQPAMLLTIRNINQSKLRELRLEEERARLRQENLMFKSTIRDRFRFGELIGKSPAMQRVYELIISAATSDVNVLVYGDSGTGKELIARTLHQVSARKDHVFVPVNCASIPETLFEREFFGHRKGSFTGADRDRPGFFDRAHLGILFLDEVTELSPGMQAKLLRVLQDGEYTPLGGNTPKQADVLIVAATNKDPREEIDEGRLRKDFFYRIGVIEIAVPSLRERKEDLPFLIEHILEHCRQKQAERRRNLSDEQPADQTLLPGELMQALYNYPWPGNVRELQNVLQRYLATRDLHAILSLISPSGNPGVILNEKSTPEDLFSTPFPNSLPDALALFEQEMIRQALAQTGHNVQRTAQRLQVPLHTLYRRMKKYRIGK